MWLRASSSASSARRRVSAKYTLAGRSSGPIVGKQEIPKSIRFSILQSRAKNIRAGERTSTARSENKRRLDGAQMGSTARPYHWRYPERIATVPANRGRGVEKMGAHAY